MTDDQKMKRGFYHLAQGYMLAYPVMHPWEIVSWIEARMDREKVSEDQLFLLKFAWNDLGRKDWADMMNENELSKGIV